MMILHWKHAKESMPVSLRAAALVVVITIPGIRSVHPCAEFLAWQQESERQEETRKGGRRRVSAEGERQMYEPAQRINEIEAAKSM